MDIQTIIVILVPCLLSSAIMLTQIVINYKKGKEPIRDEIWETTLKIVLAVKGDPRDNLEEFGSIYRTLKEFKDKGYTGDTFPKQPNYSLNFSKEPEDSPNLPK